MGPGFRWGARPCASSRALVDDLSGRSGDRHEHGRSDIAVLRCFGEDEGVVVLEAVRGQLVGLVDSFVFGYALSWHGA